MVAKRNLHFPELGFNLVRNRDFPTGIPKPAGNRDVHKSRKLWCLPVQAIQEDRSLS